MSRQLVNSSGLKRRRPETESPGLVGAEHAILDLIRNKMNTGIWLRDIKQETKLPETVVNKSLKSLMAKNLIKLVTNIQNKGKKYYMAVEFEPSKEISGGEWYVDGALDKALIDVLQKVCLKHLHVHKVATLENIHTELKKKRIFTFEITTQHVSDILNSLVLDNEIIEVKSTGLGEYFSIPIGTTCYRIPSGAGAAKGLKMGAFASIPCGACPRISLCTPDGVISPSTCVYYTKWLNIDF